MDERRSDSEQFNGQILRYCAVSRGLTLPRNSTLTYIAQRPAHVHVSRRARARTLSPRSLPAAGASHALTQPANVFFCCVLLHVFRGVILDLSRTEVRDLFPMTPFPDP